MRKRLGYRIERPIDRQACENVGQSDKLRDRLVNRMVERTVFRVGLFLKDKLRDRRVSRNDGQIKVQACEKDGKVNLAIFHFFGFASIVSLHFTYFPFVFASMQISENIPFSYPS